MSLSPTKPEAFKHDIITVYWKPRGSVPPTTQWKLAGQGFIHDIWLGWWPICTCVDKLYSESTVGSNQIKDYSVKLPSGMTAYYS